VTQPILTTRAINRATLARQWLLERTDAPLPDVLEHLVGLQAQTPHTAYVGLWTRVTGFRPEVLSTLITDRAVVRIALMRGTIHMVTARDAWQLRPLLQPVLDRVQKGQFARRLVGVDSDELVARGRAFVETEPRTFKALGDHLLERWPGRDRMALEQAVRTGVPLVQVPPRGLWGRSGPIAHTSIEAWLGEPPPRTLTLDGLVTRYLAAFGPASVMDIQAWCGLTRLGEVVERLRPGLVAFRDEHGRELFDLPDAPRPDPEVPAPPRFLYDFDNLLLSHADRSRVITEEAAQQGYELRNVQPRMLLVDGFTRGDWKVTRTKGTATLTIRPFTKMSTRDKSAVTREGERLLAFAAPSDTHDIQFTG
jgi:hypothetical protein